MVKAMGSAALDTASSVNHTESYIVRQQDTCIVAGIDPDAMVKSALQAYDEGRVYPIEDIIRAIGAKHGFRQRKKSWRN